MQNALPRAPGRRRWLVAGLTVLILAFVLAGAYWRFNAPGPPTTGPVPARVPFLASFALTVAPGIHMLGGLEPAAAYVVESSEGLVLIDTGLDPDAGPLRRQMAELGLDWKAVRAILLTHAHGDHSQGAQYLREQTGARVYAGQEDAAVLRAGGPHEALFSGFVLPDASAHPTTVDVELRGGEVVTVGNVRFEVLGTPGHTPGSICYLMERNGRRVLFSGDVIMSLVGDVKSTSKLASPLGTYSAYMAPPYRGSADAFVGTLRKLRALPAPDLVLPGHPRMDPTPQSPAMSQERWEALLDRGIRDMEQLLDRYARDGASFLDDRPKKLLPGLYYLGDWGGAAVYAFVAGSKLFVVGAPGGDGLNGFLAARLGELGVQPTTPTAVLLTSCGPEDAAGLRSLVEKSRARVVVSSAGRPRVEEMCPAGTVVLTEKELPAQGWFEVKALPLHGRGVGPMAYELSWAGKTVLFSGRIPVAVSKAGVDGLRLDYRGSRLNAPEYAASLSSLQELKPQLWLPAETGDRQNANLYDGDWEEVITGNRSLLRTLAP